MKSTSRVKNSLTQAIPFQKSFFSQHTLEVAKELIGAYLVHFTGSGVLAGRIVETEAYRQNDRASHSCRGLTPRNKHMFAAGGVAYVYFIYGMYNCFNVVTEPEGFGCAVLVRAVEPVENTEIMWSHRFPGKPFNADMLNRIANGPGKLCRAMNITGEHNGADLSTGPLRVLKRTGGPAPMVSASSRVGISRGQDLLWRFFDVESRAVSRQ